MSAFEMDVQKSYFLALIIKEYNRDDFFIIDKYTYAKSQIKFRLRHMFGIELLIYNAI